MKKITIFFVLLAVSAATFSQQTNPAPTLTKQNYLKKSKSQKTIAWILLGTGTAMMVTGSVIWNNAAEENVNNAYDPFSAALAPYATTDGTVLTAAGLIVAAGSIPLFIIAGKNKRRAASVSFKNQFVPQINNSGYVNRTIPSVNLKINL